MTPNTASPDRRLLDGVLVLDLTQYLAGPFCTRLLNDLGAEVIKVEAPPHGDGARYAPYLRRGYSGYFIQNNCGKKSICLNLKADEGRAAFKKLISRADVCVENFAPGVMARLGLDYDTLSAVNPGLIMCSISGFGQYGPWAKKPGFAAAAHALSGLMWVSGRSKGPDAPPVAPGAAFGDTGASLHAFGAICAALYRRERDGRGEYIDIALLDALFDQIDSAIEIHTMSQGQDDSAILSSVLAGKDGYATLALGVSDKEWRRLVEGIGRPELIEDERFADLKNRMDNLDELMGLIEDWMQTFDSLSQALARLDEIGIVSAPVLTIAEAVEHPQIKARDMMPQIDHPVLGQLPVVNSPFRLTNSAAGLSGLPPELGEHNRDVLTHWGGYDDEEVTAPERAGALGGAKKT